jgi:hypothetical protein
MKPALATAWTSLARAAEAARGLPLRDMFAADPQRFARPLGHVERLAA